MVNVKTNQSIFDICLQEFGQLDNLFTLLVDNSLNPNSKLKGGQDLIVNNANVGNQSVKDFVILNNIKYCNYQEELFPPNLGGDYNNDYNNDYN